ncbi:hypothetical protein [Streptomyces geranii]|uniref:hypothetical protein n=1 Tax=Streptomyces geranii TaxID=2058923 RepID=UPI0013006F21|nr:hypothetical protein [Streptomyces geranii]
MGTARRIQVVVGVSVVLAAWTTAALLTRVSVMVIALPVVGALWLLVLLESGYLLGREWAHRRRRRAGRPRRTAWAPAPEVRRPIDYPNIVARPAGDTPVDQQGRFRATGIRLAVLPALAVVFLTVQTVFLQHGSDLGLGFVLAECLLLVSMVWTVWTEQEPSRPWVTSRIRAEFFRREMFLLLTAVGPYLGKSDEEAERIRDARLNLLAAAGPTELDGFARLADRHPDGSESHWQDEVRRLPGVAGSDITERMSTYLDYRIRRQGLFFELATEKCGRTESILGRVAKGAVLAAVVIALAYAALLLSGRNGDEPSVVASVIALLAAGLPPLCNTVLAVQNLLAAQRLAVSYQETRQELLGHENTLRKLLAEPVGPELAVSFRALAVRVESTLTEELRRWRIIVAKPEFDAGL